MIKLKFCGTFQYRDKKNDSNKPDLILLDEMICNIMNAACTNREERKGQGKQIYWFKI